VDPVQLLLKNMLTAAAAAAFMIQPSCIITVYKPPAHIMLRCLAKTQVDIRGVAVSQMPVPVRLICTACTKLKKLN